MALAQRNLLAGHSTLLIDLNLHHPSMQSELKLDNSPLNPELFNKPELVCCQKTNITLTGITAPMKREIIMKLRKPGVLEECIKELKPFYNTIIFDTSAINQVNANNIPAERVSAACDGSLLVVLSGTTTEAMISMAVSKFQSTEAQLLGCVLNDRDTPTLKNELLREVKRINPPFTSIANWLDKKIRTSQILSLEI